MDLIIPGLDTKWQLPNGKTMDLSIVPPMPTNPDDPNNPFFAEQWLEWAEQVLRYRLQRWELTTERIDGINLKDQQELERHKVQVNGTAYFTTVWCSIFEARHDEAGLIDGGDWKPFIPFSFQVLFWDWMQSRMDTRGADRNGWASKSRDMGITNCGCVDILKRFLFDRPFVGKLVSRREDMVDQRGNLDSMFERIAAHLDPESDVCLPDFLLPNRWEFGSHRFDKIITRPDNRNMINGESSSPKSGRAGRSTLNWVDEGSFIQRLKQLLTAMYMTSPHTFVVSSESIEVSDEFGQSIDKIRVDLPAALIELDYYLHPFHDDKWKEETLASYILADNEDGFYREVLRQRERGLSEWIYPIAREKRVLDNIVEYESGCQLIAGIDPGKADDTAIGVAMIDPVGDMDVFLDGYINRNQIPEFYAAMLLGCNPDDVDMKKEYPLMKFGEREREFMEWMATLPQPMVYGDPHAGGGSRVADAADDWYLRMLIFSRKYNPRKGDDGRGKPLVIIKNWKPEAREHQARHTALNTWLGRLEFNPNRGSRVFLNALANSKYDTGGTGRTSEQYEPKHDVLSHPRTCLEFMAVNIDPIRRSRRAKGERVVVERQSVSVVRGASRSRDEDKINPYEGVDRRIMTEVR